MVGGGGGGKQHQTTKWKYPNLPTISNLLIFNTFAVFKLKFPDYQFDKLGNDLPFSEIFRSDWEPKQTKNTIIWY